MLLTVDIGNTQTHVGVFRRQELVHQWRASTDPSRTADEMALMLGNLLGLAGLSFEREITGVSISSVVPRATQEVRAMTERYFGFPPLVVEPGVRTGIAVLTDHPREVGADRVVNAVAAHELFPGSPVVVADFGTAITIDAVSARGDYLGGAIAPGVDTAVTALFSAAAQVPQIRRVELVAPGAAIGKSTVTSVQSGIMYGMAALADGLVERVRAELSDGPEPVPVVATGGLAATVVEHCRLIDRIEPTLTLDGLRLVFEINHSATRGPRGVARGAG